MKHAALTVLAAALLASCAPTVTGPRQGRIVNSVTGTEGTVTFVSGSLRPRVGDPFAPDNATITIGGQTYTGRTAIVDGSGAGNPLPAGWGLSVGFGASSSAFTNGMVGIGTRLDSPDAHRPPVARIGNLIARTTGTPVLTLTCTLTVDETEHGIGDCTGNDGTKYAMQF
ncbi:hypothetical protein HNQ07_000525 [Deinococcus metalli]|uniref:Uncharacterized protein n=1 Tax=Deinococcus metalli TaxID=1141878 RepID=A0A7W8NMV2_9DEIO|nr:hypothetical protein [Deinococcus metalli]MBB5375081.1 hypothetical protein [Deinococcus metalli]GHF31659.1 hypothetical protein GCM10017781_05170 [Deinococcus metalli]